MSATRTSLSRILGGLALTAAAGLILLSPASAQSGGGAPPPFAGHWGRGAGRAGWGHHGFAKVVTGAPYTAQAVTATVETLTDGTSINRQITAQIARDSQGRTMRSQAFNGFGAAGSRNGTTIVSIFDPVANQRIEYNTATKTARIFVLPPSSEETSSNTASNGRDKHSHPGQGTVQTESLGTRTTDGIQADGTQITHTIPAGAIGNSQAIQVTDVKWYSPDLQIVLESTRNDPRFGKTTYIVSNLHRTEPNESLFQVPAGYQTKTIDVPSHKGAQ